MRIFAQLHLEQERARVESRTMVVDTPARLLGAG